MDNEINQGGEEKFPMRINKYLAHEGQGSRREMDKLVGDGRVLINGKRAVLGDKVNEGDRVEIAGRLSKKDKEAHQKERGVGPFKKKK